MAGRPNSVLIMTDPQATKVIVTMREYG